MSPSPHPSPRPFYKPKTHSPSLSTINFLLPYVMSSSHGTVQNSVVDQLIHSGVQFARSSLTQPIAVLTENNHSPSQLVLLLPLLASTANLTFSAAEFLTIRPLVADRGDGGEKELQPRAVQRWWEGFWIPGLGVVVGLGLGAVGGGIRAAMRSPGAGGGYGGRARLWYGAGVFFAGAHFAFAPKVSRRPRDSERV